MNKANATMSNGKLWLEKSRAMMGCRCDRMARRRIDSKGVTNPGRTQS